MVTPYPVREATMEDYEGLCVLFAQLDDFHRKALPHFFQKADGPARTKDYISNLISDQNALLLVAESHSQLIGFVCAILRKTQPPPIIRPRRYAIVEDIIVREDVRRSGLGRSLMDKVHEWASARGVVDLELNVWDFNQGAVAFYNSLGYETTNRRMARRLDTAP